MNGNVYLASMVAVCVLIFAICVAVDKAKKKWIDPQLKKVIHFDAWCQKLDRIFTVH